jgi:AcrR family transcriptional regulator
MPVPTQRAKLTAGRRLPHGRHGLPTDVVRDHQRQRLIAAIAGCCAERGYAAASVNDIATAAAVSKKTFYEVFSSKEECLLAAHGDYRARLFAVIEEACAADGSWPQRARSAVRAALAFLAADLAGAELLATTVLCTGAEGARRHYDAIDTLATRLRNSAPALSVAYPRAEWCAAVAMSAMVGQAANAGDQEAILNLEDDFSAMLLSLTSAAA